MDTKIIEDYLGGYRNDTISTEVMGMQMAVLASTKSKDPSTQVGSCICSSDGRVISTGYNHNPFNWNEDKFPWRNDVDKIGEENTKYPYIIHSELDAISKCSNLSDLKGATIYVTLFPCVQCAKAIVSFGIKKVIFDEYRNSLDSTCSMRLLINSGVELVQFKEFVPDNKDIENQKVKIIK